MPFGNRRNCHRGCFQFSIVTIKKNHPSGNLKFNNLRIFQSLRLRILVENPSNFSLAKFHYKYSGPSWVIPAGYYVGVQFLKMTFSRVTRRVSLIDVTQPPRKSLAVNHGSDTQKKSHNCFFGDQINLPGDFRRFFAVICLGAVAWSSPAQSVDSNEEYGDYEERPEVAAKGAPAAASGAARPAAAAARGRPPAALAPRAPKAPVRGAVPAAAAAPTTEKVSSPQLLNQVFPDIFFLSEIEKWIRMYCKIQLRDSCSLYDKATLLNPT